MNDEPVPFPDPPETDMPVTEPLPIAFRETLIAARTGDTEARELLFRHVYPRVERMVHLSLARDLRRNRPWLLARFSTGDVVQEVFRSLIRDFDAFQGDSEAAFIGYLSMVVRNRLMDAVRFHEAAQRDGRRTSRVVEDVPGEERAAARDEEAIPADEMERFRSALETFTERERLLLRARIEQGATFEDLAAMLGYPSKFAARRAFYAAQALLVIRLRQGGLRSPDDERA